MSASFFVLRAVAAIGCALCVAACDSAADAALDAGADAARMECAPQIPAECPAPAPVYADVAPIFERRCASCHNDQSDGPWPLTDYQTIADWAVEVREYVYNCTMPPPGSGVQMTIAEREKVLAWIKCDAPE